MKNIVLNFKFDNSTEQRTEEGKQKVGCHIGSFFSLSLSFRPSTINKKQPVSYSVLLHHNVIKGV